MDPVFRDYVKGKKIIVCDRSATSRAAIHKALTELGAEAGSVTLISSYAQAEQEIATLKPQILIADYDLGDRCGLDLLQKQRLVHPDSKHCLFVMVTGNTSQTAVARAAEEDVDSYILKPFTAGTLMNLLLKACQGKTRPPDYVVAIEAGKKLLGEGKQEEAIEQFKKAMTLDKAPALACFYLGQANLLKELKADAEGNYATGLGYNKIHYKCMIGLFEVLMAQNRLSEAYDVVKRISQYFPANPQRLTQVLKLAIMTQSYDDVERYYQVFTKLDVRSEEIIRYVCAALVVCGKHYLMTKSPSRALELFKKAAVTGAGRVKVLQEIILALVDVGMGKEAAEYIKRFPANHQASPLFQSLNFVVDDQVTHSASMSLERGRYLLSQMNVHEPIVYLVLIRRSIESGMKTAAEQLVDDARKRWPEQGEKFKQALGWQP